MSWGLTWLGLDDGTPVDVRAVKRAYAQRLRVSRPDDDPEAFQHLHAAYQDALAWVQAQDDGPPPSGGGAHARARADAPAAAPARPSAPAVDVDAVGSRIAAFAREHDAATLEAWLQQQPELWSLGDKPAIGEAVLQALQAGDPLPPPVVACLTACFAWDDLGGDIDRWDLEAAVRRWHQAWLLSPQGAASLAQRYLDVTDSLLLPDSSVLRNLRQDRPLWRNLLTTLVPPRVNEAIGVLRALDFWTTQETPPGLDWPPPRSRSGRASATRAIASTCSAARCAPARLPPSAGWSACGACWAAGRCRRPAMASSAAPSAPS